MVNKAISDAVKGLKVAQGAININSPNIQDLQSLGYKKQVGISGDYIKDTGIEDLKMAKSGAINIDSSNIQNLQSLGFKKQMGISGYYIKDTGNENSGGKASLSVRRPTKEATNGEADTIVQGPTVTTKITLDGMNLNAVTTILKEASGKITTSSPYPLTANLTENGDLSPNTIIVPTSNLRQGDELVMSVPAHEDKVQYRSYNQLVSKNIANKLFSVTEADSIFKTEGTNLEENDDFYILTGSEFKRKIKFTYVSEQPDINEGQFNSLKTLEKAINYVDGLEANIYYGNLYIISEGSANYSYMLY